MDWLLNTHYTNISDVKDVTFPHVNGPQCVVRYTHVSNVEDAMFPHVSGDLYKQCVVQYTVKDVTFPLVSRYLYAWCVVCYTHMSDVEDVTFSHVSGDLYE